MQLKLNQIHSLLIKNRKTVSVAESCTGGILSSLFTRTPGSSRYFLLGIIAYSNTAKENILKIPRKLITGKGAVSKDVALLLARSVRLLAQSDFGIGVTGIAGPTGGTPQKPVGTVFIAVDSKNKRLCKRLFFKGSRKAVREKTALKALELLKTLLNC